MTTPIEEVLQQARDLPEEVKAQLHAATAPSAPTKRLCYYVDPNQPRHPKGFIPSVVIEDESGYYPLIGRGELSEPWFWGDLETAERLCADANESLGLTPKDVKEIRDSSIIAQIREDGARVAAERKMQGSRE